MIENQKKLQ